MIRNLYIQETDFGVHGRVWNYKVFILQMEHHFMTDVIGINVNHIYFT